MDNIKTAIVPTFSVSFDQTANTNETSHLCM